MSQGHAHDLSVLDRVLNDQGLCHGPGDGENTFCGAQLVSLVCGLPVTGHPDACVTGSVSAYTRAINDKQWSSPLARGAGMRRFLIAQIGSKGVVDGRDFASLLAVRTVNRVIPPALRAAGVAEHLVVACERADTPADAASAAADAASAAADAASAYAASARAYTASVASARANTAAYAAAYAASARAASAAYTAYTASVASVASARTNTASVASAASAADAADAAYAADAAAADRDAVLRLSVDIVTEILVELGSPGAKYLDDTPDGVAGDAWHAVRTVSGWDIRDGNGLLVASVDNQLHDRFGDVNRILGSKGGLSEG